MRTVSIAGMNVADAPYQEVVEYLLCLSSQPQLSRAYALHVGGLRHRNDERVAQAYKRADLVYADGASIVALARLAGASSTERSPTTDLGHALIRRMTQSYGRPVRIGLIGGPPGLARRAGAVLREQHMVDVRFSCDGYGELAKGRDLAERSGHEIDLLIVGLGCPTEMLWSSELDILDGPLILTCGGWFSFLAGEERRAPRWMQRLGLEWLARTAQDPLAKGPRYLRGALDTALLALSICWARLWRR